ncbi:MAG: hypothetical protein WA885_12275 [Phormidesmis sp.]
MLGIKREKRWLGLARWRLFHSLGHFLGIALLSGLLSLGLLGCVSRSQNVQLLELPDIPTGNEVRRLSGAVSEVAPPAIFLDLADLMDRTYAERPQVAIASPKSNQILTATTLTAKINLKGLSIYKDEKLGLGPHLQVILDNQSARSVYSLDEPVEFSELAPGSHTLRVFAVKPWGESFKSETAYAQTTFHVFAETDENTPALDQPLLTFNEPQGTYGAEPILLDFYLNNAPLHAIAQADPNLTDWRIRCDLNGQSFTFDQWQPIYLKGFKPGQNWVQLTLIDEQGEPIKNAFNSTVRLINYDPDQKDTLAKIVRGELSLAQLGQIVTPAYEAPVEPVTDPVTAQPAPELGAPVIDEVTKPADNEPAVVEPLKNQETIDDLEIDAGDSKEIEETIEAAPEAERVTDEQMPEENKPDRLEPTSGEENKSLNAFDEFEEDSIDDTIEAPATMDEREANNGQVDPTLTEPVLTEPRLAVPTESSEPQQVEAPAAAEVVPKADTAAQPNFFKRIQNFWQKDSGNEAAGLSEPSSIVPQPDQQSVEEPAAVVPNLEEPIGEFTPYEDTFEPVEPEIISPEITSPETAPLEVPVETEQPVADQESEIGNPRLDDRDDIEIPNALSAPDGALRTEPASISEEKPFSS